MQICKTTSIDSAYTHPFHVHRTYLLLLRTSNVYTTYIGVCGNDDSNDAEQTTNDLIRKYYRIAFDGRASGEKHSLSTHIGRYIPFHFISIFSSSHSMPGKSCSINIMIDMKLSHLIRYLPTECRWADWFTSDTMSYWLKVVTSATSSFILRCFSREVSLLCRYALVCHSIEKVLHSIQNSFSLACFRRVGHGETLMCCDVIIGGYRIRLGTIDDCVGTQRTNNNWWIVKNKICIAGNNKLSSDDLEWWTTHSDSEIGHWDNISSIGVGELVRFDNFVGWRNRKFHTDRVRSTMKRH